MATITVKSARKDGRVAFFEKDKAHPKGEVFIRGDQKAVEVGDTRALRQAIRNGNLVEVTQVPALNKQTPPTRTGGGTQKQSGDTSPPSQPLAGLGLTAEQEEALTAAGFADRASLTAASDDDLIAVSTIGKATVETLRKALATS